MLSVIILAGGKSSRMGRDKALILIDGVPLIAHVCNVARKLSENIYIVTKLRSPGDSLENPGYRDYLPPHIQYIYEQEQAGPLVAFAQALPDIKTEWVLLLACDLPNLCSDILRKWQEELIHVDHNAIAALVKVEKGWEPLCGFYRQSAVESLKKFIAQGGRSFQGWLQQNQVHELAIDAGNRQMFFNCNTPEDLQWWMESPENSGSKNEQSPPLQ